MLLNGFAFSGFRSIGDELVKIAPLKKINLIIGQNNSGKSNIITFLKEHLPRLHRKVSGGSVEVKFEVGGIDGHMPSGSVKTRVAFYFRPEGEELEEYLNAILPKSSQDDYSIRRNNENRLSLSKLVTSDELLEEDGSFRFLYESTDLSGDLKLTFPEITKDLLNEKELNNLFCELNNITISGGAIRRWGPEIYNKIVYLPRKILKIVLIPAIRKIGDSGTTPDDYSGQGIIERLAQIESPTRAEQNLRKDFDDINQFLRTVLDNEDATLQIPHDRKEIIVHMDGKILPLSSLGTGIHEVVIIAAASTILKNTILCIEEPELHLHPLLQRKLIKYLSDHASNQYIFTTHSAHILDIEDAEVFHVKYINGATTVDAISNTKDKSNICRDLGYKASDLLQANCIIWVEGPSDRIYINHWLKSIDSALVEGIHYAIMFYGGRLFSHISAEDKEDLETTSDDFISVRKLNRNACIVFDSDKSGPRKHLSKTKKRLETEFNKGPGFAWVSKGREIENYIDADILEKSVLVIHPSAKEIIEKGQWENLLKYRKKGSQKEKTADKVKVARHYVDKNPADLDILDLKDSMRRIQDFIYKANGMTPSDKQQRA